VLEKGYEVYGTHRAHSVAGVGRLPALGVDHGVRLIALDMPADVIIENGEVRVRFHRRAHPSIVLAGLIDNPVKVLWWDITPLCIVE
jgi:hypothetical protein